MEQQIWIIQWNSTNLAVLFGLIALAGNFYSLRFVLINMIIIIFFKSTCLLCIYYCVGYLLVLLTLNVLVAAKLDTRIIFGSRPIASLFSSSQTIYLYSIIKQIRSRSLKLGICNFVVRCRKRNVCNCACDRWKVHACITISAHVLPFFVKWRKWLAADKSLCHAKACMCAVLYVGWVGWCNVCGFESILPIWRWIVDTIYLWEILQECIIEWPSYDWIDSKLNIFSEIEA